MLIPDTHNSVDFILEIQKNHIMKIEFSSCAKAIRWIMLHTKTELDFQTLREQLDTSHLYSGHFFVFTPKDIQ